MTASGLANMLWHPATFVERGVAVPFTTPVLAGARVRLAPSGAALGGLKMRTVELVIPHPAGVRGVYIMTCSELPNFCAPTMHDIMVADRLSSLASLSPREVRQVARAVAATGAAGRDPIQAAAAADAADRRAELSASVILLQMLVRETLGQAPSPTGFDRQAKAAILRLVTAQNRPGALISNDIETLAASYAPIGLPGDAAPARCGRLLGSIARLATDLKQRAADVQGAAAVAIALLLSAADATLALGRHVLAETQALAANMQHMLVGWAADRARIAAQLERSEWLLDGWEQICLLWQLAPVEGWSTAISEMALVVPPIPREADLWMGHALDEPERQRLRKLVFACDYWRTGSCPLDLVSRNERLRALAA